MASAASVASGIRLPRTSKPAMSWPRTGAYRGPGSGIQATGAASQSLTRFQAVTGASGRSKARGYVAIRRKAARLCHASPTRLGPFSCSVSLSARRVGSQSHAHEHARVEHAHGRAATGADLLECAPHHAVARGGAVEPSFERVDRTPGRKVG